MQVWKQHRKGIQSLDMTLEGVKLRDLDRTPTPQDYHDVNDDLERHSAASVRFRAVGRKRGKSL